MDGDQSGIDVQGAFCALNEVHEIHMYRFSLRAGRLNADAISVERLRKFSLPASDKK
jgi:hypothetical protein